MDFISLYFGSQATYNTDCSDPVNGGASWGCTQPDRKICKYYEQEKNYYNLFYMFDSMVIGDKLIDTSFYYIVNNV